MGQQVQIPAAPQQLRRTLAIAGQKIAAEGGLGEIATGLGPVQEAAMAERVLQQGLGLAQPLCRSHAAAATASGHSRSAA